MIIGLAGAKTAGKNTVAKMIAEEFGNKYEVKEWSFAEDLKRSAAAALGIQTDDPVAWCDEFKEEGTITVEINSPREHMISGREYLQYYGTEAHRDIFDDDFWVGNVLEKIHNDYQDGDLSRIDLITDVRFPNEAEAIKYVREYGELFDGAVIKVKRPSVENHGDTHASEIPLPDELIDRVILNDCEDDFDTLRHRTGIAVDLILNNAK